MFPSITKPSAKPELDPKIKFLIEEASRLGQALIEGNNQTVKTRLAALSHEQRSILRGVPKLMKLAEECGYLDMAANHLRLPPPRKLEVNHDVGAIINDNVSFKTLPTLPTIKQTENREAPKPSSLTPRLSSARAETMNSSLISDVAVEASTADIIEAEPAVVPFAMAAPILPDPTPSPSSAATAMIDEDLNPSSELPSPRAEAAETEPSPASEAREATPAVTTFTEEALLPPIPSKPTKVARAKPTEKEKEIIILRQTETLKLPRISGDSDLHHMARHGLDQLLITELDRDPLRAKDRIKLRNNSGQTLLHLAASSENLEIADLFLTGRYKPGRIVGHPEGFINMVDENRKSALHIAVEKGNIEMAQLLIDNGAKLLPGMAEFSPTNPDMRDFIASKESALNPYIKTSSPSPTPEPKTTIPLYIKAPQTLTT